MNKWGVSLVELAIAAVATPSAFARPDYLKQLQARYKETKIIKVVTDEVKCNTCHYGKTKKNRNDYGTALSKLLNEEKYNALKGDKEKLAAEVDKMMEKVEGEKSVSGKTFLELIKDGKLPGTTPADAKE